jgi:hypothetical protein
VWFSFVEKQCYACVFHQFGTVEQQPPLSLTDKENKRVMLNLSYVNWVELAPDRFQWLAATIIDQP